MEIDLEAALETLNQVFGIKRLLLEGGGAINGSFLAAGLVDEVNILVGTRILREYQRRLGDTEAALQMYAGSLDEPTAQYAAKVFAEKARLDELRRIARKQRSA